MRKAFADRSCARQHRRRRPRRPREAGRHQRARLVAVAGNRTRCGRRSLPRHGRVRRPTRRAGRPATGGAEPASHRPGATDPASGRLSRSAVALGADRPSEPSTPAWTTTRPAGTIWRSRVSRRSSPPSRRSQGRGSAVLHRPVGTSTRASGRRRATISSTSLATTPESAGMPDAFFKLGQATNT